MIKDLGPSTNHFNVTSATKLIKEIDLNTQISWLNFADAYLQEKYLLP
jgi:hypothetical protein